MSMLLNREDDPNLTEDQIKEKKRAFLQKYEDNIRFYPVRYAASKMQLVI